MNELRFYRTNEPYGFLSNFAPYPILLDSFLWPTSEHYFQASKFLDDSIKSRIREIKSPMKAAEEGRNRIYPIRPDWDSVKDDKMRTSIRTKFLQHHEIKMKLLETGDSILIEHTTNDHYWADGGDGSGKNVLGILLMELRKELSVIARNPEWVFPPWIAFPEIHPSDMFWRMGRGEEYIETWFNWYKVQEISTQKKYEIHFSSKGDWAGFYDS